MARVSSLVGELEPRKPRGAAIKKKKKNNSTEPGHRAGGGGHLAGCLGQQESGGHRERATLSPEGLHTGAEPALGIHDSQGLGCPSSKLPAQGPLTCSLSSCSGPAGVSGAEAEVSVEVDGGVEAEAEAEASMSPSPRGDSRAEPRAHSLRTRGSKPVAGSWEAGTGWSRHFRERGVERFGVGALGIGGL